MRQNEKLFIPLSEWSFFFLFWYIDTSVLLKNTPLVKFIRNYIRDPSDIFSISSLVRILVTSFPAFSRLFMQTVGEKWRAIDLSTTVSTKVVQKKRKSVRDNAER